MGIADIISIDFISKISHSMEKKGLSSLPIQDIAEEYIDTDNEYMYYYSVEFMK